MDIVHWLGQEGSLYSCQQEESQWNDMLMLIKNTLESVGNIRKQKKNYSKFLTEFDYDKEGKWSSFWNINFKETGYSKMEETSVFQGLRDKSLQ